MGRFCFPIQLGAPIAAWMIVTYPWKVMFIATGPVELIWLVPWLLMVRNGVVHRGGFHWRHHRSARRLYAVA